MLILASQSPRRKELLSQLGYKFKTLAANIDETVIKGELPAQYVLRLAKEKAQFIAQQQSEDCIVLGSDTSVVLNQRILGKPENIEQCCQQLMLLSNNTHQVLTAIAAVKNKQIVSALITTEVTFKTLTIDEIKRYWQTGEPQDKAGAYGIQGIGGQFVTQINGSYSAVVGLPLYETAKLLAELGRPTPIQATKTANHSKHGETL
ncbi:MAG: septum formation inhibitor Maf [Colwellia sp.]|nr:septum formation inhibitor Maf [Colwellia sp.]